MFIKLTPEETVEENLQDLGGGGTYRCREMCPNDKGQFVLGRQRTIAIDGPRKELTQFPSAAATGDDKATVTVEPGTDVTQLANAETQRILLERLLASERGGPTTDWAAILPAVMTPLLTFIQAMMNQRPQQPDPVDLVAKIATIFKENTSPASNLKDQVETMEGILGLKQMAKELEAESGPEDPLMALLQANVPKVVGMMEAQAGKQPATTPAPVAEIPATTGGDPVWARFLVAKKPQLIAMARDGKDPTICADSLLELMLPVAFRGQLAEFMQRPDAVQLVFQYIPELKSYEQWTVDFMNRLFENLFGVAEVVEDEPHGEEVSETVELGADSVEVEEGDPLHSGSGWMNPMPPAPSQEVTPEE
ncbi:MAG: hypothetical protein GY906_22900 [bacterium]|nr:hypothetical protein [bacterium]